MNTEKDLPPQDDPCDEMVPKKGETKPPKK